jgi:hypothetical protein
MAILNNNPKDHYFKGGASGEPWFPDAVVIAWVLYNGSFSYCSWYNKHDGKYGFVGIVFSL